MHTLLFPLNFVRAFQVTLEGPQTAAAPVSVTATFVRDAGDPTGIKINVVDISDSSGPQVIQSETPPESEESGYFLVQLTVPGTYTLQAGASAILVTSNTITVSPGTSGTPAAHGGLLTSTVPKSTSTPSSTTTGKSTTLVLTTAVHDISSPGATVSDANNQTTTSITINSFPVLPSQTTLSSPTDLPSAPSPPSLSTSRDAVSSQLTSSTESTNVALPNSFSPTPLRSTVSTPSSSSATTSIPPARTGAHRIVGAIVGVWYLLFRRHHKFSQVLPLPIRRFTKADGSTVDNEYITERKRRWYKLGRPTGESRHSSFLPFARSQIMSATVMNNQNMDSLPPDWRTSRESERSFFPEPVADDSPTSSTHHSGSSIFRLLNIDSVASEVELPVEVLSSPIPSFRTASLQTNPHTLSTDGLLDSTSGVPIIQAGTRALSFVSSNAINLPMSSV
ncbi:hypothetical protein D9757_013886 [Collybiopsis confluens]|uniref:Uncharacterized protein n=1 Tax=Collybiopsis confluens TaxID=2823264 RepID=A0A8H5CLQ3_9AGAR|nr:hypothetical protein D9757_013886 [Collybiopsis confluens]